MFDVSRFKLDLLDEPALDRLLVLQLLAGTPSEVLITDPNRERPERGIVLKAGPGGITPITGTLLSVLSKVGQLVTFGRYAGITADVAGEKSLVPVLIMADGEVLMRRPLNLFSNDDVVIHDDDPRKVHLKGLICEHCPRADMSAEREAMRAAERAAAEALSPLEMEKLRLGMDVENPRIITP